MSKINVKHSIENSTGKVRTTAQTDRQQSYSEIKATSGLTLLAFVGKLEYFAEIIVGRCDYGWYESV